MFGASSSEVRLWLTKHFFGTGISNLQIYGKARFYSCRRRTNSGLDSQVGTVSAKIMLGLDRRRAHIEWRRSQLDIAIFRSCGLDSRCELALPQRAALVVDIDRQWVRPVPCVRDLPGVSRLAFG